MRSTVLLIDEDVNARIIAETLLRVRGLQVCVAADESEAYDIVRRGGVGVVVLDLGLPGMDGLEVIRQMQGRFEVLPLATRPRMVVVTTLDDPEVGQLAMRLGADAFLHKPIAPRQFLTTIEDLMAVPRPCVTYATSAAEMHAAR